MKNVIQLDEDGYFIGLTVADESPLEPNVFLLPARAIDAPMPVLSDSVRAKWNGEWIYETLVEPEPEKQPEPQSLTYAELRYKEYPPITDYIDGMVKGDQQQIDEYISACLAVKAKYPKP